MARARTEIACASGHQALVLLDLKMPRITGFEILLWIRKNPAHAQLPVIVLSGSQLEADVRNAYAAGANSYFVKPLGFDALVDLVKNVNGVWLSAIGPVRRQ